MVLVGVAALVAGVAARPSPPAATPPHPKAQDAGTVARQVDGVVARMLALPYDPAYPPTGVDTAFGSSDYPAAFPLTDTATGTCCAGPVPNQPTLADLAPPFPSFPDTFDLVTLRSYDGTPLHAFASIVPGAPGIVVAHGFNSNGKYSVVRYAAFLRANGFSVIAPDHRDLGREWDRGGSENPDGIRHGESLGWKEAQDLLTAADWLHDRGVPRIGMLGFSEGAQNTVLALGQDLDHRIDAALTFSGPADQATLAQRSPATTAALLAAVVDNPDLCGYLAEVGQRPEFRASPDFMLRHDSAVDTLDGRIGVEVGVPAVHLYAQDDRLVPAWNATVMASRTTTMPSQRTVLLRSGNHAYFTDRWWAQSAILTWFRAWLDPQGVTTATPTVARSATGRPARTWTVDLSQTTRADGDAQLRPRDACPPAAAPIGPTAALRVTVAGRRVTLDGRRSYSGWDAHHLVRWRLDPGDGTRPITGTDLADARATHVYRPGGWRAALTVVDDTGRTTTTYRTVTVPRPGR